MNRIDIGRRFFMEQKQILLIIPAYNEAESIEKVLINVKKHRLIPYMDVLVIDDGSLDDTAQKVKNQGVKVISQVFNMGYGVALQTGYKYAVEHRYEYVIQMDADGQHDLVNLDRICEKLGCLTEKENAPDIVVGSRFLEGSQSFKMSKLKMIAIHIFRIVVAHTTGCKLTDLTSGLQGMNKKAFSYYAQYQNFDTKYPDLNMLVQMLLLGFEIQEIPAIMYERVAGVSMHAGLLKAGKYMILMSLSTLKVYLLYRKKRIKEIEKRG